MDALVARLRRYRAYQQMETVSEVAKSSGLPVAAVARALAEQERIDGLLASALVEIASQGNDLDAPPVSSDSTPPDWFDVYSREAKDRCEGELREAFVRILAGEIQRPGTFSVRTLRVLGMLDQGTASLFRKAVSVSVRLEFPYVDGCLSGHIRDVRIPELGRSLGHNGLAEYGLGYRAMTSLTEAGLLHAEYSSSADYGPLLPPHRIRPNDQIPMVHQDRMWLLMPRSPDRQGSPVHVTGAMFTKAGQELLRIVDVEEMPRFTEQLRQHFESGGYEMLPHMVTECGGP